MKGETNQLNPYKTTSQHGMDMVYRGNVYQVPRCQMCAVAGLASTPNSRPLSERQPLEKIEPELIGDSRGQKHGLTKLNANDLANRRHATEQATPL